VSSEEFLNARLEAVEPRCGQEIFQQKNILDIATIFYVILANAGIQILNFQTGFPPPRE
jgi:hypothetical protein